MAGKLDNLLNSWENGDVTAMFDDFKESDPEGYAYTMESAAKTARELEKWQRQQDRQERREATRENARNFFSGLFDRLLSKNDTQTTQTPAQTPAPEYTKYILIGGAVLVAIMLFKK